MNAAAPSRALYRWALATMVMTVFLTVGLGGVVTSTETGMAYPTWPNINAQSLFNFFYGSLASDYGTGSALEHTHRQAGALVGILSILCVVVAWRKQRELLGMSALVLILIIIQGLLGAFRVLGNTQGGAIIHAVGAQVVIVALMVLVKRASPRWTGFASNTDRSESRMRLRTWTDLGIVLLFLNLLAAASLRHKVGAFSGHLVLALTASAVLLTAVYRSIRDFGSDHPSLARASKAVAHTIGLQVGLGLATWAFLFGPLASDLDDERSRFLIQTCLASAHLVLGVVLMAAATNLAMEARRAS